MNAAALEAPRYAACHPQTGVHQELAGQVEVRAAAEPREARVAWLVKAVQEALEPAERAAARAARAEKSVGPVVRLAAPGVRPVGRAAWGVRLAEPAARQFVPPSPACSPIARTASCRVRPRADAQPARQRLMVVATLAILPTSRQREDLQERMARWPTLKCRAPHSRSARKTWYAGFRLFRAVRLSEPASSGRARCRAMRSSSLPRVGATGRRSIGPAAARLPYQTDLLRRPSSTTGRACDVRQLVRCRTSRPWPPRVHRSRRCFRLHDGRIALVDPGRSRRSLPAPGLPGWRTSRQDGLRVSRLMKNGTQSCLGIGLRGSTAASGWYSLSQGAQGDFAARFEALLGNQRRQLPQRTGQGTGHPTLAIEQDKAGQAVHTQAGHALLPGIPGNQGGELPLSRKELV